MRNIAKELRARTGAGMMDCKNALKECGDVEKAVDYLREKGLAKAAKKAGREASQGLVFSYIHTNGKIGVLLELNCETDFVARTDEFAHLGHELCMQVAATNPPQISDHPAAIIIPRKNHFIAAASSPKKRTVSISIGFETRTHRSIASDGSDDARSGSKKSAVSVHSPIRRDSFGQDRTRTCALP